MSAIDERLVQDIAAVTGGVVVTDTDLRDARNALDERIDARRRRDRRLTFGAAAAVVAVVGLVGYATFRSMAEEASAPPAAPAPSTTADPYASFLTGAAPTPDLVNGVWRVDNGILLVRFTPPNKVYLDNGGELFGDPRVQGTYVIDGDVITVSVVGGKALCGGQTFSVRASLPSDGAMRFVFAEPGTGACVSSQGEQWELEQVLPTSEELTGIFFPSGGPGWDRVDDPADLSGIWVAQGGGYVLEVDTTGSYYVADESGKPVDLGQWSLDGTDLTLTSAAGSSECADGDRLVLGDVELVFGAHARGLRGTVGQNACGGPWATKTWVRFPDG